MGDDGEGFGFARHERRLAGVRRRCKPEVTALNFANFADCFLRGDFAAFDFPMNEPNRIRIASVAELDALIGVHVTGETPEVFW
jgi:hypothetical protein